MDLENAKQFTVCVHLRFEANSSNNKMFLDIAQYQRPRLLLQGHAYSSLQPRRSTILIQARGGNNMGSTRWREALNEETAGALWPPRLMGGPVTKLQKKQLLGRVTFSWQLTLNNQYGSHQGA